MKKRANPNNKNDPRYKDYAGRGIATCDKWNDFAQFKEDMYQSYLEHVSEFGEANTTLERIDVDGDYSVHNCRWATPKEQCRNKRKKLYYELNGEKKLLVEWAELYNMKYLRVWKRVNYLHWDLKDALTKPVT